MKTIDLESWSEFRQTISNIRKEYLSTDEEWDEGVPIRLPNQILFRGQANADWDIKTTLERATDAPCSVSSYLQKTESCANEIESFTGRTWKRKSYPEILGALTKSTESSSVDLPNYDYLVYLRHHGFPSPLLDWTSSPYVAAYFAFEPSSCYERCAIFAYIETPMGFKSFWGTENRIQVMGPHVTTHARHFAQKCWYTIATKWDEEKKRHAFCSHHSVHGTRAESKGTFDQDVLIKITVPCSDRAAALIELEDYSINHYTLFRSEDALARTLALRKFDLNQ